jgi:hypothetical protein
MNVVVASRRSAPGTKKNRPRTALFLDLRVSRNDYDWRGNGIYFWEYSYQRAFQWAHRKAAIPAFLTSSIPETTLYP